MICLLILDLRGHHHAAYLHEQLPAVQWDQWAGGSALCPLHWNPRPQRAVPQVLADYCQSREQVHQKVSRHRHGRGCALFLRFSPPKCFPVMPPSPSDLMFLSTAGECWRRCSGFLQRSCLLPNSGPDDAIGAGSHGWEQSTYVSHTLGGAFGCLHWGQECVHRDKVQLPVTTGWHSASGDSWRLHPWGEMSLWTRCTEELEWKFNSYRVFYRILTKWHSWWIRKYNSYTLLHLKQAFTLILIAILQVKIAYINFLNHCYVDTEVEMKEIYTSNHMWKLFDNFLVDICRVRSTIFTLRRNWKP